MITPGIGEYYYEQIRQERQNEAQAHRMLKAAGIDTRPWATRQASAFLTSMGTILLSLGHRLGHPKPALHPLPAEG